MPWRQLVFPNSGILEDFEFNTSDLTTDGKYVVSDVNVKNKIPLICIPANGKIISYDITHSQITVDEVITSIEDNILYVQFVLNKEKTGVTRYCYFTINITNANDEIISKKLNFKVNV